MQRVIVELQGSALAGTRRVLAPGDRLRVGRRQRADLIVSDDQMSAPHFEMSWDGSVCRVQDLASIRGTFVGGEKVDEAVLHNGAWIRAGSSDFLVFFEAATPRPYDFDEEMLEADADDLPPLAAQWLSQNRDKIKATQAARAARAAAALAALRAVEGPLYAVIDATRSDRVLTLLHESVEPYRSLYEGVEGEALAHVAPYLVELPRGSGLLQRLLDEGWQRRWSIFIACPRPFKEVRRHLRRLLITADADTRERFYFRFYDPVVLRTFVPVATPHQLGRLFGPISDFFVEGERGEVVRFDAPSGPEGG